MSNDPFAVQRQAMVETQLMERGILDPAVLAAMRTVPREAFVPVDWRDYAYYDGPLPIAEGQTISQPYIVALMTQELQLTPHDRVLEVGTGSGYGAAVLSCIAAHVYTVERLHPLAVAARQRLRELGFHNVQVLAGNGTLGWPEHAPYDAIVVTAEGPSIPQALQAQLALGGRLIIPVGAPKRQSLMRVIRHSETAFEQENLGEVRFVPLIGAQGWPDSPAGGASEPVT
jgi:protein-L-isoaspartate(D-aspartate) O-methyltransferase